jgi:MSHA biogenesis protein MshQ
MKNSAKAIFILFSLLALSGVANANVTVTRATGGGAIASNTAPGCSAAGTWTALTGPAIAEANSGEIGLGNIVLSAPAGFEFNTAAAVTIRLVGSGTNTNNINNIASGTSVAVTSITATAITFNVTIISRRTNTLTWQGIQVRPTASTPLASGNITETGPSTITGMTGLTNLGTLTEVTSAPACNPTVLAEYRMDEASWNGTAGEVLDNSGSGNNAQSFNSANTAAITPAIAGNPGTCGYGVFDNGGTITQGYVQTPLPNLTTDFTITAWIRTTNNAVSGQRILIDDQNNSGGYGFSLADGTAGLLRFYSRGIAPVILDSTYTIANNTWYFVAAVADITNRIRTIYVYSAAGTLLASTSDAAAFTGIWGTDAGPVSIGGEVNGPPQTELPASFHFKGNLDEVRVYGNVLSQSALAAIATQTHVCPVSGPNHILVQHDGNGLTCTPETLTVIACANAACTTPNYTASAVTGVITWAGTPGGTISFNIIANGTTTVSLPVTTVQTVTLGTSAVNPAALNASTCWNTSSSTASCSLPFASSGLLVSAPNHVSGTPQNITISAVRSSNNGLNCVPAFANVSRTVNLKCSYTNPTSGTLPAQVAGVALNSGNNAAVACDATGQSPSLSFNASGVATTALQYNDVGQVVLNAIYTGSVGTGDSGLSMTGSGSFIAAPAFFAFSGITAPPIKAGTNFSATVTAKNNVGNPTPNFGKETSPEGVTLSFSKYQPTGVGAVNGIFSGSVGAFNNGVAIGANFNWSEVGTIDLNATLASGNYLTSGVAAATGTTGATGAVGGFIPDHFNTVVTQGCSAGSYSYSGQPFGVQVKAMNGAATTVVTQNYDGTANTSPNFANVVTLSDASGAGVGTLAPTTVPLTAFSAGVAGTATLVTPAYTFTSRTTAATPITLRAVYTNAAPAYTVTSSGFTEGTTEIRSGRARFNNAHGSEILALPVPFHTEYWNNGWVINTADSCTGDASLVPANAVSVTLTPPVGWAAGTACVQDSGNPGLSGAGCAAAGPTVQKFKEGATPGIGFAGNFNLWLKAPGVGNTGAVTVTGNVPAWLQYPWGGGAATSPTARATFGVYKGANEFIYLRENY